VTVQDAPNASQTLIHPTAIFLYIGLYTFIQYKSSNVALTVAGTNILSALLRLYVHDIAPQNDMPFTDGSSAVPPPSECFFAVS